MKAWYAMAFFFLLRVKIPLDTQGTFYILCGMSMTLKKKVLILFVAGTVLANVEQE